MTQEWPKDLTIKSYSPFKQLPPEELAKIQVALAAVGDGLPELIKSQPKPDYFMPAPSALLLQLVASGNEGQKIAMDIMQGSAGEALALKFPKDLKFAISKVGNQNAEKLAELLQTCETNIQSEEAQSHQFAKPVLRASNIIPAPKGAPEPEEFRRYKPPVGTEIIDADTGKVSGISHAALASPPQVKGPNGKFPKKLFGYYIPGESSYKVVVQTKTGEAYMQSGMLLQDELGTNRAKLPPDARIVYEMTFNNRDEYVINYPIKMGKVSADGSIENDAQWEKRFKSELEETGALALDAADSARALKVYKNWREGKIKPHDEEVQSARAEFDRLDIEALDQNGHRFEYREPVRGNFR